MSSSNTTIDKLRRYKSMRQAEANTMMWLINPKDHPLPLVIQIIPEQIEWLRGEYLKTIQKSAPHLAREALELVEFYLNDVLPSDYDDEH